MPLHDYRCQKCGLTFEALIVTKPAPVSRLAYCPACKDVTPHDKQISAANFNINGFSEANGYAEKGPNEETD